MSKNYTVEKFKTMQEWLSARGFGGSSASALLDLNPYVNKLDIYLSAVNPAERKHKSGGTVATQYGRDCESLIANIVRLNLAGNYIVKPTKGYVMYRRKDKPYITATLDGVITKNDTNEKYILEIKTHLVQSTADYQEWKSGKLPKNYLVQCIHYMMCLNDFKGVLLVAKLLWVDYDTGMPRTAKDGTAEEILYYWIERQDYLKDIEYLEQVETDFQVNNIDKRVPPDIELSILRKEEVDEDNTLE